MCIRDSYYAGQQHYDTIERLAIERAKTVFRAEHANVQPLSGSPMNQAVYFGLLKPGETILAMDLSHGGHLTHGSPLSHMGKIFHFVRYKTSGANGDIDTVSYTHLDVYKRQAKHRHAVRRDTLRWTASPTRRCRHRSGLSLIHI